MYSPWKNRYLPAKKATNRNQGNCEPVSRAAAAATATCRPTSVNSSTLASSQAPHAVAVCCWRANSPSARSRNQAPRTRIAATGLAPGQINKTAIAPIAAISPAIVKCTGRTHEGASHRAKPAAAGPTYHRDIGWRRARLSSRFRATPRAFMVTDTPPSRSRGTWAAKPTRDLANRGRSPSP